VDHRLSTVAERAWIAEVVAKAAVVAGRRVIAYLAPYDDAEPI
jgi:hypothetical protein